MWISLCNWEVISFLLFPSAVSIPSTLPFLPPLYSLERHISIAIYNSPVIQHAELSVFMSGGVKCPGMNFSFQVHLLSSAPIPVRRWEHELAMKNLYQTHKDTNHKHDNTNKSQHRKLCNGNFEATSWHIKLQKLSLEFGKTCRY